MLLRETTKDTFMVLANIVPHIENILKNPKVVKMFNTKIDLDPSENDFMAKAYHQLTLKVLEVLPVFLTENMEDVFMILAILNDTCIVDIENQHPLTTVKQVKDLIMDKELMGFVEELMK